LLTIARALRVEKRTLEFTFIDDFVFFFLYFLKKKF